MSTSGRNEIVRDCLVAVVNNDADLHRFTREGWYRIPARTLGKGLGHEGLRQASMLALYQTAGVHDGLPGAIELWGEVTELLTLPRREIIPDEPAHPAAEELYHLVRIGHAERLPAPIVARRPRRITFLRTTRDRLLNAADINDLIVGTPAEERLWRALREEGREVERRIFMNAGGIVMEVDFALFQEERAIGLLCGEEGRTAESGEAIDAWRIIRFSQGRIDGELAECLAEIAELLQRMRDEGESPVRTP